MSNWPLGHQHSLSMRITISHERGDQVKGKPRAVRGIREWVKGRGMTYNYLDEITEESGGGEYNAVVQNMI